MARYDRSTRSQRLSRSIAQKRPATVPIRPAPSASAFSSSARYFGAVPGWTSRPVEERVDDHGDARSSSRRQSARRGGRATSGRRRRSRGRRGAGARPPSWPWPTIVQRAPGCARGCPSWTALSILRDVHHRDATGAQIQMADLAVAHLTGRQPDVEAARADERRAGTFFEERGERGRAREPNGVVGALLAVRRSRRAR